MNQSRIEVTDNGIKWIERQALCRCEFREDGVKKLPCSFDVAQHRFE